jgi:hypothetical protein
MMVMLVDVPVLEAMTPSVFYEIAAASLSLIDAQDIIRQIFLSFDRSGLGLRATRARVHTSMILV